GAGRPRPREQRGEPRQRAERQHRGLLHALPPCQAVTIRRPASTRRATAPHSQDRALERPARDERWQNTRCVGEVPEWVSTPLEWKGIRAATIAATRGGSRDDDTAQRAGGGCRRPRPRAGRHLAEVSGAR